MLLLFITKAKKNLLETRHHKALIPGCETAWR